MIGLLILAQKDIATGLLATVEHTLGGRPPRLDILAVEYGESPEAFGARLVERLQALDEGQGVLILADIYGATHTNVANRLLRRGHIEMVTGVNVPMLLKVLNYRHLAMDEIIDKALSGGCGGIVCAANVPSIKEAGG